jgi:hypothetical protein
MKKLQRKQKNNKAEMLFIALSLALPVFFHTFAPVKPNNK